MKKILERFVFTLALPFLVNCQLDARLDRSLLVPKVDSTIPFIPLAKSSVYSGQSISLEDLFATNEYTNYVISSPDGYFDSASNSLVVPKNLTSKTTELILTSPEGDVRHVTINILGLDESFVMETPQSYGDQNYPNAGTKLLDGTLLVGAVIVDSAGGWEWAVVHRSSDNGVTWNVTDRYQPYNNGESHLLAMANDAANVYSCGYQWDFDHYDSEHWYVRRSTDSGKTWTPSETDTAANIESICQTLAVSPATGYVYAGGYDKRGAGGINRWVIKESRDQGQSWSIIYTQDVNHNSAQILQMQVSPNNTIWFTGSDASNNAVLYEGTFSGSWSFANMGVNFGKANRTNYEVFGELDLRDNNTAYLSSTFGTSGWNIKRTLDGGVTWTQIYSAGSNTTKAGDFEVLSDGTLLAIGTKMQPYPSPREVRIVRSTDGGNTWSASVLTTGSYSDGCLLFPGPSNSIHAISSSNIYASHFYSTNSGATWSEKDFIVYTEKFYNEISKLLMLPSGSYLSLGWIGSTSKSTQKTPWFLGRSADKGATWNAADYFVDPLKDFETKDATYDKLGNVYALGMSDEQHTIIVRKSVDDGQNWSTVEQYTHPTYPTSQWSSGARIVADQQNNLYYGAFHHNTVSNKTLVQIRKGAPGGTTWNTVNTFPQNPSYLSFSLNDLKVDRNNVLWLAGYQSNGTLERVLYKSSDGGTTWSEIRREATPTGDFYKQITFDSHGNIYLRQDTQIQKSIDGGATWTTIMDSTYSPRSLLVTSNDKIFVLTANKEVLKLNEDGSWMLINDQSEKVAPLGRGYVYSDYYQVVSLYQLNSDTIGLHTRYNEAKVGVVDFMKTLKISE